MPLSLDKVADTAPELLSLAKNAQAALGARNLGGLTARVTLVLDFSGSMRKLYQDGSVQRILDKALAFATQVDDDGEIDLFIFGTEAHNLGTVSLTDFRTAVADTTKGHRMGTTNYADAIDQVTAQFGGQQKKKGLFARKSSALEPLTTPEDVPTLALFITDGVPDSKSAAKQALTDASYRPVFWQFLSIGPHIPFLQKLDDLDGRYIDNADYKNVADLDALSDTDLFDMLLDEYPAWVEEERRRGQIR